MNVALRTASVVFVRGARFASSGASSAQRRAIILGGSGSLGREIVSTLKSSNWWVANVDLTVNMDADYNVHLPAKGAKDNAEFAKGRLYDVLGKEGKVQTVICTAGGWVGENLRSPDLFEHVDRMHRINLLPALTAGVLSSLFLSQGGLIVLTGANAALFGTPDMVAYGLSKAATHQLVLSLSADRSLPPDTTAVGLMPFVLDTPANRTAMPQAARDDWTPPAAVAEKIRAWAEGRERPPRSGSLVSVVTQFGQTKFPSFATTLVSND